MSASTKRLERAFGQLYSSHRIVFWYDEKQELWTEFDALDLPGVAKIVLANNEFGVKHRILREEPGGKFLLYHAGPEPEPIANWLLDVQLANTVFHADQMALWLAELGLGPEFGPHLAPHAEFFQSIVRRSALAALLKPDNTPRQVRLKLLAVAAGAEPRLEEILEALLAELAAGKSDRMALITRCGLDTLLWESAGRAFGYTSTAPTPADFALQLFGGCYKLSLGEPSPLHADALVFLKRWKDSVRHQGAFETLSARCAGDLAIAHDLQHRPSTALADVDLFELVDKKVLSDLSRAVADRTVTAAACTQLIARRRAGHWYDRYADVYAAVDLAAAFFDLLTGLDLTARSLADGIQQYARTWYRADQLYRQCLEHSRRAGLPPLLEPLLEQVENHYTTNYVLPLNIAWQQQVDAAGRWEAPPVRSQATFYEIAVRPFLLRNNKVAVIISDALRYEAAEELLRLVRQEDRYDAEIEPLLAVLPSFTQLGMAALLPHEKLALAPDATATADGLPTQGTEYRRTILDRALRGKATAIKAEDLLALGRDESRALMRDCEVLYVYHNRIDAVGDKRETEHQTVEAVAGALDDLLKLIKKLANANANNMVVTADHGFLFQQRALEESDFASQEPEGANITFRNRRFVLGTGLAKGSGFRHFTAAEVGLAGDVEILIPKAINRLRLKGSGSRYVHGGAALQEVVVPLLRINKKRTSDVRPVEVEILRGPTGVITAGQFSVTLYQAEAVTEKVQERTLRAGLYSQAGKLISDQHTLTFATPSDNARDRERTVQFVLTKAADAANNQEVALRLEEQVPNTTHWREYKSVRYTLRRSFTSDFDF
jgi:uncharacterized protein (TIGR02687 family)